MPTLHACYFCGRKCLDQMQDDRYVCARDSLFCEHWQVVGPLRAPTTFVEGATTRPIAEPAPRGSRHNPVTLGGCARCGEAHEYSYYAMRWRGTKDGLWYKICGTCTGNYSPDEYDLEPL